MSRDIVIMIKKYIDDNLFEQLSIEDLASRAGFSTYHFSKLFSFYMEIPVMEYIRRMRIANSISDICKGKRIIDVALDCGFESHSGFSKAFKKIYGYSPDEYRKRAINHRPPSENPLSGIEKAINCNVTMRILHIDGFYIAGKILCTSEFLSSVSRMPAIWNSMNLAEIENQIYALAMPKCHGEYYISFPVGDNFFRLVSGVKISSPDDIEKGLYVDYVEGGSYAIFSPPPVLDGKSSFAESIASTWRYIYDVWLPNSEYMIDGKRLDYEFYDERCHNEGPYTMDICIPIKTKKGDIK